MIALEIGRAAGAAARLELRLTPETDLIRACAPADMDAITAIYREAVLHGTGTFEIEPPDAKEMGSRAAFIARRGYPYVVASEGGEILGFAYASSLRDRPAFAFTVEDSVYVRADQQGRGLGLMLLQRVIDACAARGFRQMVAVIGDSANAGSIALHRKAGFTNASTLPSVGWKAGRWLDVVIMQRPLGSGDTRPPR